MGDPIKFVQTATISGSGATDIYYIHPPEGKPSKVGLISAYIASGTQTGKIFIFYGNDITNTVEIGKQSFTAANPDLTLNPDFVIYPGQVIHFHFTTITAGDQIRVMVGGH